MVNPTIPEVRSSPIRSPHRGKDHAIGYLKIVTLCAISAAFAATSTSLLCVLILNNSSEGSLFERRSNLKARSDLDKLHALRPNLSSCPDHMERRTSEVNIGDGPRDAARGKSDRVLVDEAVKKPSERSGFDTKNLDFAIIGWPKTGTSFLLNVLGQHPEVIMPDREFCDIIPIGGEAVLAKWLDEAQSKDTTVPQKRGIKCPTMIRQTLSIENLAKLSDATRLVIGVRHPVLWFESFYNYRVKEIYDKNRTRSLIQSPLDTISPRHWDGVSTEFARYDMFLKQLGKVPLSFQEIIQLSKSKTDFQNEDLSNPYREKRISPSPFKVFIYTHKQLSDKNTTRQERFRTDLQEFLRLEAPIINFSDAPKINSNQESYPEYLNICDPKYVRVKKLLLTAGRSSSEWILRDFVKSSDVVVSDMDFFVKSVKTWSQDPCKSRKGKEQKEAIPHLVRHLVWGK